MSRRKESSVFQVLMVVFGICLFFLIVFGVFLGVSQKIAKLDPAEYEPAENTETAAAAESQEITQETAGFTMTTGISKAGQVVNANSQTTQTTQQQTQTTQQQTQTTQQQTQTAQQQTQTAQQQTQTTSSSEYICPQSSSEYLNSTAVNSLISQYDGTMPAGKSVPQMIINEIYAKHGYLFQTSEIQAYFNAKSWYNGYNSDMNSVSNTLNAVEKANVDFLRKNYTG